MIKWGKIWLYYLKGQCSSSCFMNKFDGIWYESSWEGGGNLRCVCDDKSLSTVASLTCYICKIFVLQTMYALDLSINGGRGKAGSMESVEQGPDLQQSTNQQEMTHLLPISSPALSLLNCYYNSWLLSTLAIEHSINNKLMNIGEASSGTAVDLAATTSKSMEVLCECWSLKYVTLLIIYSGKRQN